MDKKEYKLIFNSAPSAFVEEVVFDCSRFFVARTKQKVYLITFIAVAVIKFSASVNSSEHLHDKTQSPRIDIFTPIVRHLRVMRSLTFSCLAFYPQLARMANKKGEVFPFVNCEQTRAELPSLELY